MRTHSFTVTCKPGDPALDSDGIVDALYEAGCDDALVIERASLFVLEFDREASTLKAAISSALANVDAAGLKVQRVGPDPLVSAADIAERTGLSRQAVSFYATGKRGRNFPSPIARVDTDSPLWRWQEIAAWFAEKDRKHRAALYSARRIERTNSQIQGRGQFVA